jgi:dTDP-4-dehydrorhamnose reductase
MPRLLITGASGLLGANLVLAAHEEHEVIAVYHRHPIELEGGQSVSADLCQPGRAKELFDRFQPDWVIHCAADTSIDELEGDPERAFRMNRDMAGNVAEAAREIEAKIVHISTDAVFDGREGPYREGDPTEPVNVYGKSKLAGEDAVQDVCPEALILRTNIFGWNAQPKASLAEWFLSQLERGEPCPGLTDIYFSPLLVNDLGELILAMLSEGLSGVLHVPGADCISKYDFGISIARLFGYNPDQIIPTVADDLGFIAPRPARTCLLGHKLERALGIQLPSTEDGLYRFRGLRESGFSTRLRDTIGGKGS